MTPGSSRRPVESHAPADPTGPSAPTPRNRAGAGGGLQLGIPHLGASIAPATFGMIADRYDIYTGFYCLAGTIAFANVLVFFLPGDEAPQAKPVTAG